MKVIAEPRQVTTELPDAEALIKEARSHQRKRWLIVMVVVLTIAGGIALAVSASSGGTGSKPTTKPTPSPPPLSPTGILRLDEKGLSGNFETTYKLSGNLAMFAPVWTVVVAHRGPNVFSKVWTLGEWSYLLKAGAHELQWIEDANRWEACWRQGGSKKWSCGKGTAPNDLLFILPYVPDGVEGGIYTAVTRSYPMGHGEHQRLTVVTKPSAKFGKLDCLTNTTWFTSKRTGTARTDISAVTWCLTAQGLPASEYQRGNPQVVPPWLNLTLVSTRRVAPQSDFEPMSSIAVRNALPGLG
jgi:hypothetical protein